MNAMQTSPAERLSYGLSDLASNLIFAMFGSWIFYFYTDVAGLDAAAIGTLFLIARCIDAFDGPVFGLMIDHTRSRYGKCRPWFLWLALPVAAIFFLTFLTPQFSDTSKFIYACVTYLLLSIGYSAINVPVTAILPSLTSDPQERTILVTIRMVCAAAGTAIISLTVLPTVNYLGEGDQARGFMWLALILSLLILSLFLITFKNLRERVIPINKEEKLDAKTLLFVVRNNRPWIVLVLFVFFYFMIFMIKMQSTVYYMTYNFGRQDLTSAVLGCSSLSIIATLFIPLLTGKFSKKGLMIAGLLIFAAGQLLMWLACNAQLIPVLFTGAITGGLGMGIIQPILFTMVADTVDYSERKTGIRAQGFLSSAPTMGVKTGMGLGGALSGWLLAAGGYVAGATQTSRALDAITLSFIWLPIGGALLAAIIMTFYNPDDRVHQTQSAYSK